MASRARRAGVASDSAAAAVLDSGGGTDVSGSSHLTAANALLSIAARGGGETISSSSSSSSSSSFTIGGGAAGGGRGGRRGGSAAGGSARALAPAPLPLPGNGAEIAPLLAEVKSIIHSLFASRSRADEIEARLTPVLVRATNTPTLEPAVLTSHIAHSCSEAFGESLAVVHTRTAPAECGAALATHVAHLLTNLAGGSAGDSLFGGGGGGRGSSSSNSSSNNSSSNSSGGGDVYFSCHHCKTRMLSMRIHKCTNYCAHAPGKAEVLCRKKFCDNCLTRIYPTCPKPSASDGFVCPSCRGVCKCATCRRERPASAPSTASGGGGGSDADGTSLSSSAAAHAQSTSASS